MSRVYRHRPWVAATVFLTLLVIAAAVPISRSATATIEGVVRTAIALAVLAAFAAFLVLSWRVRTVVGETAVTQHWITKSFTIAYADITAMELDAAGRRWFIRVHRGEHTFEVMSCQQIFPWETAPPKALVTVLNELERRTEGMTTR